MNKRKEYKISGGFTAYECEKFYDELKDVCNYNPCNLAKNNIKKQFKKLIKFVVIDASIWNKLKAYWKRYFINFSYGFYDIDLNTIFVNIKTNGVNANKDCEIIKPSVTSLKKLSEIISHEYIHYQFQVNTNQVLNFTKQDLLNFYKFYWTNVVDKSILNKLYVAHFYIATNTNKNILDPVLGKMSQIQLSRFINILQIIKKKYKHKILATQTFDDTLETIRNVLQGSAFHSDLVDSKILKCYKLVFNDFPPKYLQVGQELVMVSEILSVCANMKSSKAQNVVKKILSLT